MIQYLYKYRPDDIYTIKLLCEQRLHFSHPYDFNDPFDCKPLCAKDVCKEDILNQLERENPLLFEIIKNQVDVIQEMGKSGKIQRTINDSLNMHYVCCFSYNADIPAMWAHYAQDHYGLCLGFDKTIDSPYLKGVKGIVRYSDKQTEINWTKIGIEKIGTKSLYFEKANEWAYEQEYRIVKHRTQIEQPTDEYNNSFKKEALVAMFFGLRMPEERQNFYIDLCKQYGYKNISFFKMTMPTDGTYHLKPEKIELTS